VYGDTQLKWLQADANEPNAKIIAAVPEEPTFCEQTAAHQHERKPESRADTFSALRLETGWIDIARQQAASIIETITPSKFAPKEETAERPSTEEWIEIEPELRPPRIDNPATRYGVWWHDFAERISWRSGPAEWQRIFERAVAVSPDVARSKREWQLLQKQIESSEGLARYLRAASLVWTEMPFFWKINGPHRKGGKCLEGIVDLALFSQKTNEIFVLDWKTNRITADKIDALKELYQAQLAAYWQAISSLTSALVTAAIYSTATGQFVVYERDELTREWERLCDPPQDALGATFSSRVRRG
jgi:ATP-dependent exoDNAse (exonuclease V) beta subunit